jgi:predicted site-specific integrase-resolvase
MKDFLNATEIAKLEKINPMTVSRWIKKGVFPNARKVGKSYRVSISDYQKWRETTKIKVGKTSDERPSERTNER